MEHRTARRPRRNRSRIAAMTLGAVALLSPMAACSSDDDASGSTTSTSDSGKETATVAGFCEQAFSTEAAMSAATEGEEPDEKAVSAATAELDQLQESAPESATDVATAVVAASKDLFAAEGPPSEEFTASYAALVDWLADNCGYQVVEVSAHEYAFEGLPAELASGPTIVRLANHGNEAHEIAFAKRKDGTTEPVEELLALPEDQAGEKLELLSGGFAMPGSSGGALVDLSKGDYIAVCFVPTGMTAEAMASPDGPPADAMPHAMQGMTAEFSVG